MFPGHGGKAVTLAQSCGISPADLLDVSASLSPFGPPQEAIQAFHGAEAAISHYPEIDAFSLRQEVAAAKRMSPEQVLVGAGTTEFIYLIVRTLRPTRLRTFLPTYSDYIDAARVSDVLVDNLQALEEEGFARLLERALVDFQRGDMLVLCNPNNPTGNRIPSEAIWELVEDLPDLTVLVDEAYMEFLPDEPGCLKRDLPKNLIILQSPTKFFCIPGLRLGYCFAEASVTAKLLDAKLPWTTSAPAMAVGRALLSCRDYADEVHKLVTTAREWLSAELSRLSGLTVFPGAANFLLCRLDHAGVTAGAVHAACLEQGVVIRDCTNFAGLDERFIRLAIRTEDENQRVVRALTQALDQCASSDVQKDLS